MRSADPSLCCANVQFGGFPPTVALSERSLVLPLAGDKLRAGFSSPAKDFTVKRIDLTQELVTHPQAAFLLRVRGDSMREAGIFDGVLPVPANSTICWRNSAGYGGLVLGILDSWITKDDVSTESGQLQQLHCLIGVHHRYTPAHL